MADLNEKPWQVRVLPDLAAFLIGLGIAWHFKWEAKDLVWSLWLCSLMLGYLTLFSALGGGALFGLFLLRQKALPAKQKRTVILVGVVAGLFFLAFFSFHFGGFHAGHSVFLNMFFPLEGLPEDGFGRAFTNPPLLWMFALKYLFVPYGVFLIPAIIAERKHVFRPLFRSLQAIRQNATADEFAETTASGKKRNPIGDAMVRPYQNVIRMHLLIFFFAFAHLLKIDSFLVYAVVYSVYFFPWRELKRTKPSETPAEGTPA